MNRFKAIVGIGVAAILLGISVASANQESASKEIYASSCMSCHAAGVLNAPKLGVAGDWEARRKKGIDQLVANAINGINAMPPRGGNAFLKDSQVRSVVEYMLAQLDGAGKMLKVASKEQAPAAAVVQSTPKPQKAKAPKKKRAASKRRTKRSVNSFNRLMKPPSQRNPPPARDGIHDPSNDGTHTLQHPKEAFSVMPKANSGNRVNWVAALDKGDVQPRFDLEDESKKPVILDLNIIREVKGSMPDVVYPHKQHTEWLDCSNCHPAIFLPKKGANSISMASILLGEKCGVCHGKVAFPVADCRRCHSKNKPKVARK